MALIVIGLIILTSGVLYLRATALSENGIDVEGKVTEVEVRRSLLSGNSAKLYGPTVTYRDPLTEATVELPPGSYSSTRYEVGQRVTLNYDPSTRVAKLPTSFRIVHGLALFGVGIAVIALGILDLTR